MRGIVVGAVISAILCAGLAWCAVCACTWLGVPRLTFSTDELAFSAACIAGTVLVAAVWAVSGIADAEEDVVVRRTIPIN